MEFNAFIALSIPLPAAVWALGALYLLSRFGRPAAPTQEDMLVAALTGFAGGSLAFGPAAYFAAAEGAAWPTLVPAGMIAAVAVLWGLARRRSVLWMAGVFSAVCLPAGGLAGLAAGQFHGLFKSIRLQRALGEPLGRCSDMEAARLARLAPRLAEQLDGRDLYLGESVVFFLARCHPRRLPTATLAPLRRFAGSRRGLYESIAASLLADEERAAAVAALEHDFAGQTAVHSPYPRFHGGLVVFRFRVAGRPVEYGVGPETISVERLEDPGP